MPEKFKAYFQNGIPSGQLERVFPRGRKKSWFDSEKAAFKAIEQAVKKIPKPQLRVSGVRGIVFQFSMDIDDLLTLSNWERVKTCIY